MEILRRNRKKLLNKFIEADTTIKGRVSHQVFSETVNNFARDFNIKILIKKYDPNNSGSIRYFPILTELCDPNSLSTPLFQSTEENIPLTDIENEKVETPQTQENPEPTSPRRKSNNESPVFEAPDVIPSSQFEHEGEVSELTLPPPSNDAVPSQRYSPRSNLDSDIFAGLWKKGNTNPSYTARGGGRGKLDPLIFGEKPLSRMKFEQKQLEADECKNAKTINGLSNSQISSLITKNVGRAFRGSKHAYEKWRGSEELLTPSNLRNGLARDCNIILPLDSLSQITSSYGINISHSGFVRMLADGAKYSQDTSNHPTELTVDEVALRKIAQEIHGNEWEDIILHSRSVEDIVRGLDSIDITVDPSEIRLLTSKLGKTGLIEAIHAKL